MDGAGEREGNRLREEGGQTERDAGRAIQRVAIEEERKRRQESTGIERGDGDRGRRRRRKK